MAWVGTGVGAVVVAALLITLAIGGVGHVTSVPPALAVTFGQATTLARSDLGAGTWSLLVAVGVDLWNGTTLASSTGTYPANCTVRTQPSPPPLEISVPPYRGNLSNGAAAVWVLEYVQPATYTLDAILVSGGVVSAVVTISGPHCPFIPAISPPVGWAPVDSSVAAQAIFSSGGAAYLSAHREGASLIMALSPLFTLNGSQSFVPMWSFAYTPCNGLLQGNLSGPANGTAFDAIVNASTGYVENAMMAPAGCQNSIGPPLAGIQNVLYLGAPGLMIGPGQGGTLASRGCASGDYCYELAVQGALQNVSAGDMALSVTNGSANVPSPVPRGYAFVGPTGQVLVYSVGPVESTWTPGAANATTPLTSLDSLWIDMGPSNPIGLGYFLQVQGEGPYAGSGLGVSLP